MVGVRDSMPAAPQSCLERFGTLRSVPLLVLLPPGNQGGVLSVQKCFSTKGFTVATPRSCGGRHGENACPAAHSAADQLTPVFSYFAMR